MRRCRSLPGGRQEPSNVLARRLLAWALIESGRVNEAFQQAAQAVELSPTNSACHRVLSVVLARQGQPEPAIAEARRAVELGPEDLSACRLLSNAC